MMHYTVSDLLEMEIDIDVYDDYDERCAMAFIGPVKLTEAGEKKFKRALGLEVKFQGEEAIIHIENGQKHEMENDAEAALELIAAAAGYCPDEDYERWFEEDEDDENGEG